MAATNQVCVGWLRERARKWQSLSLLTSRSVLKKRPLCYAPHYEDVNTGGKQTCSTLLIVKFTEVIVSFTLCPIYTWGEVNHATGEKTWRHRENSCTRYRIPNTTPHSGILGSKLVGRKSILGNYWYSVNMQSSVHSMSLQNWAQPSYFRLLLYVLDRWLRQESFRTFK
jgi:hypothetical protein